ncbi:AraC family transcriptional regulator [Pseudomonas sp. CGJS7]|uniref:AraC family transcriptional regulator n=1 Tax=Pseudomonas sp. CGJS7 TaxID=3109348 RepID=UPI00300880A8
MTDRLEALLERFSATARLFHAGALCGINDLAPELGAGQLHLVRGGAVEVINGGEAAVHIDTPSLLLYPRPLAHRFITDAERGADLACANLHFEGGAANPIANALPAFVCVGLDQIDGAQPILALLFEEAFDRRCGRHALINRLFEVVLIQVLRHLMESGRTRVGMLAGLSHPQLRHALVAIHESAERDWTLDALAARAGMSRSVFANAFRDSVGCTPGIYLQQWRVGLAQQSLLDGRPLKTIAMDVGYGSEAALSRAFKASTGLSPRAWKTQALREHLPAAATAD